MLYYVNINKKRVVGRNNQQSTRPITLEYDVTEVIDFQFIDDNNQLQPLSPNTPGLTLAIGLKQNMPSYDLLALSHDYEIVNGQTLRFTVNTYTVNWLKKINKPNTEVFIEISQQSLESKKVWMRDYCYVWPRVYTAGLEPAEIESNDYYTKAETDEAIENAIEGIGISGYVTNEEFEEGLATKQNTITDENKLDFTLLSGVPNYVSGLTLNGNPVEVVDGVVGIPRTSQNDWGVVKVNPGVGIGADSGQIYTIRAESTEIAARTQNFKPIVPSNLNEAVKAALTDANHVTLTDAEKTTAQTVLGVDEAISGFATEEYVDNAVSGLASESYVNDAVSGKQDAITNDNKLDYNLLSGTPTIPTKTSDLTNDSDFVTSSYVDNAVSGLASESYVDDALSGKQDVIDDMNWLPATSVRMDINHYSSDPDFDVQAAVNMTRDDVYAVSGVVSGLLSSKQDAITNDNKLDYSLISGAPAASDASWGAITGTLSAQTDLQTALDAKADQTDVDTLSGELEDTDEMLVDYITEQDMNMPLYCEALESGTVVRVYRVNGADYIFDLEYKVNNNQWNTYVMNTTITLDIGDRIYFRRTGDFFNYGYTDYHIKTNSGSVNLGGNIMSIVDKRMHKTSVTANMFNSLFVYTNVIDASHLYLPAPTLNEQSYYFLFNGCGNLEKAPKMMFTSLAYSSCTYMFRNTKITEIEVHFTDWNNGNSTYGWMEGAPASGIFKCPAALDTTIRDTSHIPEGWTVVNI